MNCTLCCHWWMMKYVHCYMEKMKYPVSFDSHRKSTLIWDKAVTATKTFKGCRIWPKNWHFINLSGSGVLPQKSGIGKELHNWMIGSHKIQWSHRNQESGKYTVGKLRWPKMAACWWPKWLLLVAKMAAGNAVAFCFVLARLAFCFVLARLCSHITSYGEHAWCRLLFLFPF